MDVCVGVEEATRQLARKHVQSQITAAYTQFEKSLAAVYGGADADLRLPFRLDILRL